MTRKERAFQRKLKEMMREADRLKDAEVKKVVKLLAAARKEVAATVASTEWQAYYLPQTKAAIERALEDFGGKYGVELREAQREFWEQGINMVDMPLRTVGIMAAIPEIDTTIFGVLQEFATDKVAGLTKAAIDRINTELTLGMIGQKSPYEVMRAIGRNLKDKGVFKSIAARAEVITRTEAGRVLSAATQARQESAVKVVPGLQKEWRHSHTARMPRPSHLAAEGQIRDIDKPFNVGGEELMYPRDARASAANTVRCGCYSVPYHPSWDEAVEKLAA